MSKQATCRAPGGCWCSTRADCVQPEESASERCPMLDATHQTRSRSPGGAARQPAGGERLRHALERKRYRSSGGWCGSGCAARQASLRIPASVFQQTAAYHLARSVNAHSQAQFFSDGDADSGRGLRDADLLLAGQLIQHQGHVVHLPAGEAKGGRGGWCQAAGAERKAQAGEAKGRGEGGGRLRERQLAGGLGGTAAKQRHNS